MLRVMVPSRRHALIANPAIRCVLYSSIRQAQRSARGWMNDSDVSRMPDVDVARRQSHQPQQDRRGRDGSRRSRSHFPEFSGALQPMGHANANLAADLNFVTDGFDDIDINMSRRPTKSFVGGIEQSPQMRKSRPRRLDDDDDMLAPLDDDIRKKPKRNKPARQTARLQEDSMKDVYIPQVISIGNLARLVNVPFRELVQKMNASGLSHTSRDHLLSADDASLAVLALDRNPVINSAAAFDLFPRSQPADTKDASPRPPIVAVMGHVDHGKTSLLDALRKTSVAAGEAGGITQHIGAFSVQLTSGERITFLDTPGHAAFSAMRARGAKVTDIVVLVVAADDGVMPQTVEAINHALAAQVPIVVAINKCDKSNIDLEKVKMGLVRHGVELEDLGGETQSVKVSALTGLGLAELQESLVTLAETMEIRSDASGPVEGYVIESHVDRGQGITATVIVKLGTLRLGDVIVAGTSMCKVRGMVDDTGAAVAFASPGTPVKVTGWREIPSAGDEVLQAPAGETQAKQVVQNRTLRLERDKGLKALEAINEQRRLSRMEYLASKRDAKDRKASQAVMEVPPDQPTPVVSTPELAVVLKCDVDGSVEAVLSALEGLPNEEVRFKAIHAGVGPVTESDVDMAGAAKGFSVKVDRRVMSHAKAKLVTISTHRIIYELIDYIKQRLVELLPKQYAQKVVGEASVLQLFDMKGKQGVVTRVAGCRITNGQVKAAANVRVMRNGETVYDGTLASLRHVKKNIDEAGKGMECGMIFNGFQDAQPEDIIQAYNIVDVPRTL